MNQTKRDEILKLYNGLRVTDVNDALDAVGLTNVCIMDRSIRPLWRDIENFKHRFVGFAVTYRYLPSNIGPIPKTDFETYKKEKSRWYNEDAPESFFGVLQKGDVVVIDCYTNTDVGFSGSMNTYAWINAGAVGVVTNGGCRDTDELIKQEIPVYSAYIGRGIRPGRIIADQLNVPVNVGGALVRPGDLIVADGDGVVVVPIEKVYEVAEAAWDIANEDKGARRKEYEKAGRPLDFTV
jgi:regulator of RNase E activity RraA